MRVWRLYREKVIISIVLGLIVAVRGDAQSFSLSNNVVYSATLTPNLGFETRVDSTWTVGLWGGLRPWPTDDKALRKYRHLSLDLYTRKWTGGTPWRGFYYGFDALWTHYNLSNLKLHYFGMFGDARHRRMQGNLYGGGSFAGYAWDLGSGFGVDVQTGVDLSWTRYRVYDCVHCGAPVARKNKVYLLPKAAVDLVYSF